MTNPTEEFPESVPVLVAGEIIRNQNISANGKRRCLYGWNMNVFQDIATRVMVKLALLQRAKKRKLQETQNGLCALTDNPRNSTEDLAKLWNDTMRIDFGYKHLMDRDS